MLPTLSCPTCRKPISLPEQFAGAVVNCPHCANPLTVPQIHELAPAPVVLPVKSGNQGAAMGAFEDMPNQSARRTKYAPASPNYPKLIFFLLLGAIAFAVVGGIAAYFILIAIPDSEYHERTAESRRLLDDYIFKSRALRELSNPSSDQRSSAAQARSKYLTHLSELVDFCASHRYMPDADGRLAAREKEIQMAYQLP
jgi:hypothetical protein